MTVLQQTAESKAKAIEEIRKTGFINCDVLLAHHPQVDNHFAGVPSKMQLLLCSKATWSMGFMHCANTLFRMITMVLSSPCS
jgi:hypothetical protein